MQRQSILTGKRILLGVTGSIAAYKAADILRRLTEQGADVCVTMTEHATRFVSPLTFETLSNKPVLLDEFSRSERSAIGHIEITDSLDAALVAPATANIIGKIAAGIADDALTSAIVALACPLMIAPAMNTRMYDNAVVRKNVKTLRSLGVRFVEPGTGSLACGTTGQGRLADTEVIIRELSALFVPRDLAGKTILVTAGPTREPIDAVRFISNPSTGKMGYALAAAAAERGAEVILITGPTGLRAPQGAKVIAVQTAAEMHGAVFSQAPDSDVVIMAAAVSDFRPAESALGKIKKDSAPDTIRLERTADILAELGRSDGSRILVGFAAETESLEQNAVKKLKDKNLDMIVANDLLQEGAGFGSDTNRVVCFERSGERRELAMQPKTEIARTLIDMIAELMVRKNIRP